MPINKIYKKARLKQKHRFSFKAIDKSDDFDADFYRRIYVDVSADAFWSDNPLLHYLEHGASEGRKPNKTFDSQWYVENNPDVEESGMNPLVHYILHGKQEGRRIHGNRYDYDTRDQRELLRNTVINHLWGGYSKPALTDLQAVYSNKDEPADVRFFAAWHAARWYFYIDEIDKVLELAQLVSQLDSRFQNDKATAMMFAYGHLSKGQSSEARKVAESFLQQVPHDTDMLLTLANTEAEDAAKLDIVNRIYTERGLAAVHKRNTSQPLSFANITGQTSPVHSDDKVSVIMPIFNAENDIASAIQSLLDQAYQNLEIIVVDDRSTDSTFEIVSGIADREPRVKAFQQEKNGGAYLARNRGLKEATGQFITTHDSDDWSHPDKIATQVELLQRKEAVMGVCLHWTRALDNLTFTHNWNLNARLVHWNHSSFLFRREVIDELGPWDSVIVGGDTEFIWRVQSHYGHGSVVKYKPNIPFSFALDDEGSLTRTKATHVKTIHNGLRHIYRSAAQWWHAQDNTSTLTRDERKFPAPKAMLKRGDNKLSCDAVVIADFTFSSEAGEALHKAQAILAEGGSVGLLHWPEYKSEKEDLQGEFFSLLLKPGCEAVVYGMEINCSEVYLQSDYITAPVLEARPVITTKNVTVLTGEPVADNDISKIHKILSQA